MSHSFNAFGTPAASSPNPREHVQSEDRREVGLFHLSRQPPIISEPLPMSCEEDLGAPVIRIVEHHIPRGDGRDSEERAYVGGSMILSPMRCPSPPLLKGGRRKSGSDLGVEAGNSALKISFDGGSSMALKTTDADSASDARACEEAKLWREQFLASQQAPTAGASSLQTAMSADNTAQLLRNTRPI